MTYGTKRYSKSNDVRTYTERATIVLTQQKRQEVRQGLKRMETQELLRRTIRAIRRTRDCPDDKVGQVMRNLLWAEMFCRGEEMTFHRALKIVRKREAAQRREQIEALARRKAR